MKINFLPLNENDVDELARIMKRAFDNDALLYEGVKAGGPPGYDDGTFLKKWAIEDDSSIAYRIMVDDQLVGAFILWNNEDKSYLGNMFVDPEYHNQRIGRRTWRFIEEHFRTALWTLETPVWATRNHHFYENVCGFSKFKIQGDQQVFRKTIHQACDKCSP